MAISKRYTIERNYIKLGKARSGAGISKVRFLVAHETANNNANADGHFRYFNDQQPSASAHTLIDDCKVLEIVPLWEKAWHVNYNKPMDNQLFGDDANDCAIGVELCRTGDFAKAYDRYVWYFAYLCKHFALDPRKHIVSHKKLDPERRSDPESWLNPHGITWDNFINHVSSYVNRWDLEPLPTFKLDTIPTKSAKMYRLAHFIDSSDPEVIKSYKEKGYKVIETPEV